MEGRGEGEDPGVQPGGLHQGLHQERQLLRLAPQGAELLLLGGGEGTFLQQRAIQQQVGDGGPGLVGDVSDEGGDLPPLLVQGSGGGGGAVQEAGQPGLQGGGNGLVEGLLQKAVVNGLGQHPVQPVRLPSGAPPVVQAEQDAPRGREEGEEQKRDRHGSTAHT